MENQQDIGYQKDLFIEQKQKAMHRSENRENVNGAKAEKGKKTSKAEQRSCGNSPNTGWQICRMVYYVRRVVVRKFVARNVSTTSC